MKYLLVALFCFVIFSYCSIPTHASVYDLDYTVTYTLNASQYTDVTLDVLITHNRSDLYVDKFNLTLPAVFDIDTIRVTSDQGDVSVEKEMQDQKVKLSFAWLNPEVGNTSQNNLHIMYRQNRLTRLSGNVLEAILPTMSDKTAKSVTIIVNKSPDITLPLTIAKPRPDTNDGITMRWNNMKSTAVYLLFGEYQLYDVTLHYALKNNNITPGFSEIAFPPETLVQDITIDSIEPKPDLVYIDSDGNYMAKYALGPYQEKSVIFKGIVKVFPKAQEDMIPYIRSSFETQKTYLLGPSSFWDISKSIESNAIPDVRSPYDIYHYVVDTLNYSSRQLSGETKRLGAQEAVNSPMQAVCTEFTDTFIAIAREKGIYAREHEGYAYSQNETIQPVSLVTDILHAWPEFFDLPSQRWMEVDPTWEDTSGIDYFSSLDINHITFAIHGKDSAYPLPAGMYKTKDSKDVSVSIAQTTPQKVLTVQVTPMFDKAVLHQKSEGIIKVKNIGNSFIKNKSISLIGQHVRVIDPLIVIGLLAPYEERVIHFSYTPESYDGTIQVLIPDLYEGTLPIVVNKESPVQRMALISIGGLCAIVMIIFLTHTKRKRKHRNK